jgi:hypothetical protein
MIKLSQFLFLSFSLMFIDLSWGLAPRILEKRDIQGTVDTRLPIEVEDQEWYFSRFAFTLAPFAEIDLELLELKIQPYVEIRFDRKVMR